MEITVMTYRISKIAVQFGCTALLAGTITAAAVAGDQGIINQRNPLDATERFYMHPAHLYLSSEAPRAPEQHQTVVVTGKVRDVAAREAQTTGQPSPVTRKAQKEEVAQSGIHRQVH
jgi:hypothetical protein